MFGLSRILVFERVSSGQEPEPCVRFLVDDVFQLDEAAKAALLGSRTCLEL